MKSESDGSFLTPGGSFAAPDPWELSSLLGGYEVIELIACGGMGAVYRARQVALEREVAIKVLPRDLSQFEEFRKGFQTEARAMAKLNHPNLIGVYDFGEVEEMFYLVMEYVDGASLFQAENGEAVEALHAVRIVAGVAEGLGHAHKHGVLHRDIKPANILITRELEPKLGDFGLAVPTADVGSGMRMGTPGYVAPEVVRDFRSATPASDVYSLGVILHEMLTGVPRMDETPPDLDVVPRLRGLRLIVQRATAPEPFMRCGDGGEMAETLTAWLAEAERVSPHVITAADPAAGSPRRPTHAGPAPLNDATRTGSPAMAICGLAALLLVGVFALGYGGYGGCGAKDPDHYSESHPAPGAGGARPSESDKQIEPVFDVVAHQGEMRGKLKTALDSHVEAKCANLERLRSRAGAGEAWAAYFALADEKRGRLPRFLSDDEDIRVDEAMAQFLNQFAVYAQSKLNQEHARTVQRIHKVAVATMEKEAPDQLPIEAVDNLEAWLMWLEVDPFEMLDFDPAGIWKAPAGESQDPETTIMIGPRGDRGCIIESDQEDRATVTISSPGRIALVRESDGGTWLLRLRWPHLVVTDDQGEQLASLARRRMHFEATKEPAPPQPSTPPVASLRENGKLAELRDELGRILLSPRSNYGQDKDTLDQRYLGGLKRVEEEYRDDLDTENALLVRTEINRFERAHTLDDGDLVEGPDKLADLQKIYLNEIGRVSAPWLKARGTALRAYCPKVAALKDELTRDGELEQAMAAKKELDRVRRELEALTRPRDEIANRIPKDAYGWGGHHYKVFATERISFTEAKEACAELGGHLAYFETVKEHEMIAEMRSGRTLWIGGTDCNDEGTFQWLNGKPLPRGLRFNKGENSKGRDYLHLKDGTGIIGCRQPSGYQPDLPNKWVFGYVCEWDE